MLDQNTSRAKLEQTMVRCLGRVRKVDLSYSANRNQGRPLQVKVARRYRVTIPNDVREKAKISVGDELDVRYEDGRILLEKARGQLGEGHGRDRGQLGQASCLRKDEE